MTSEMRLRVSAVIPVYNGARYLAETIESVLAQTRPVDEIIVVDDGSTDGSAALARSFSAVHVVVQPQSGAATARNLGVETASGNVIAFLDADDLWTPEKNEMQAAVFEREQDAGMVFGYAQQFVSPDVEETVRRQLQCPAEPMAGYIPSAAYIRRDVFARVGMFLQWQIGDFIDWYARAAEHGIRSVLLPDVVVHRRLHGANLGVRERASQIDYVRIARAALQRRRKQE